MILSIIIPVYNGEKYLENCLKNVFETFKNNLNEIEIIIVENGSTDNTKKVIKNCKSKWNFINITSKKGVSNARNKGIKISKGKYILFLDCDDKLSLLSVNKFLIDLKQNSDLYIYDFIKSKNNKIITRISNKYPYSNFEIIPFICWMMEKPTIRCTAWSKVFSSSIIKKNNIYFKDDLNYAEDSEFVLRYIKNINSFKILNYTLYNYVLSNESAMRSYNSKRIEEYHKSLNYTMKEYSNSKYKNSLSKYILVHLNIIMVHDIFIYRKNNNIKKDISKFKKIYKNSIYDYHLKNIKLIECLNKELIPEFFLKIKLNIITYLLCYLKSYINQK